MAYTIDQERYKKALLEKGFTIGMITQKTGISGVTISKIAKGGNCRATTANKIAKALNVPVTELFE